MPYLIGRGRNGPSRDHPISSLWLLSVQALSMPAKNERVSREEPCIVARDRLIIKSSQIEIISRSRNWASQTGNHIGPRFGAIYGTGSDRAEGRHERPRLCAGPAQLNRPVRSRVRLSDNQGTLNIRNKYPTSSAEDLALQQPLKDWNGQLAANGPMTRQAVTPQTRQAADRAARLTRRRRRTPVLILALAWHRGMRLTLVGAVKRRGR